MVAFCIGYEGYNRYGGNGNGRRYNGIVVMVLNNNNNNIVIGIMTYIGTKVCKKNCGLHLAWLKKDYIVFFIYVLFL